VTDLGIVGGFSVGSKAEIEHTVTSDDVRRFVELTGDDNPLHVDPEFAAKTSFKQVVAHGMLGASFISTVIGKHIPGRGALWVSQSLEFLVPVRIGDRLRILAEVKGVQASLRILTLKTDIRNQHDQLVLTGESKVRVMEAATAPISTQPQKRSNRVAIITGASRGIGAETALRLASSGFAVIVNYREDKEGAQRVVAAIEQQSQRAIAVQADIARPREVKELVETAAARFGGISAIVNNASAPIIYKPFARLSHADLETQMEIQYYGAFELIQAGLPFLEAAQDAAVVSVSSVVNDNAPPPQVMAYAAAKAALASMTRSLAVEYGPKGIRFNVVSPGMTDTAMIAGTPEKAKMLARMQAPLRRLAQAGDVAEGIVFLLSPKAAHITGETLRICGGGVMV
jgi:3-oxoacyl-[acyl-carrier protein] reductase